MKGTGIREIIAEHQEVKRHMEALDSLLAARPVTGLKRR